MDVDSTLITTEVIEMLAVRAGSGEEVTRITESAMRGEIDFGESLVQRVQTLAGLRTTVFAEVIQDIVFTPGAPELIRELQNHGWEVALVSGGFEEIVAGLASQLNISLFRANRLEEQDGVLTGRTVGPVIDRAAKAVALREYAEQLGVPLSHTIAIGDGANDLDMLAAAGFGIAFNAKPVVQQQADASVKSASMLEVLNLIDI